MGLQDGLIHEGSTVIHKMKNFCSALNGLGVLVLFVFLLFSSQAAAEFKKTKIAVLDFELHGNPMATEGIGGIVAEWFTTALVQDGRFDVIERAMLQKIIEEQKLAMSGIVDESTASKLGKILGVENVITGSVLNLKNRIEVNARIIGVENGSIVAAENVVRSSVEDLQGLVNDLTQRIVYHFPMTGYVVKKKDKEVMIDLGRDAGLHAGMEFIVYKEGEVIRHPKTGEVLDVEKIHTGRIRITQVHNNMAEAKIIKEEGEGVSYGQMVQSVSERRPSRARQSAQKARAVKKKKYGRLTVKTFPAHALVRILNIGPKYYPGMKLTSGKYHLEVSSPSYTTLYQWVDLPTEKKTVIEISLVLRPGLTVPVTLTPQPPPRSDSQASEVMSSKKASRPDSSISSEAERKEAIEQIRKNRESSSSGYRRDDFAPGERDTLASGRQAPAILSLHTGSFMMGGNRYLEKPRHYVIIAKNVSLATSEVTFTDYMEFCADTGAPVPDDSSWGQKDRPVVNVTWNEAVAYTKWLTKQTGVFYRLPYECEWEWAARSGEDVQYSWGSSFRRNMANCKECGSMYDNNSTAPVRSFPPNKFGFFDMSGNVWEWVHDCWVDNYVRAPKGQSEREFKGTCTNRTVRGGAWNSPKKQVNTSARLGIWAETKSNYIGFRVVRDASVAVQGESEDAMMPTVQGRD